MIREKAHQNRMNLIVRTCILFVALEIVFCAGGSFNDDIHVIRIKNNGSQTRTIYLPKQNCTSSDRSLKYYKKIINELEGNKFVLVNHFGSHSSHMENTNRSAQKQTVENDIPHYVNNVKYKSKIQKLNISKPHQVESSNKKRITTTSTKNTVQPTKKYGVEIKVNPDKIAKLLNIFTIVNFTNELCYSEEGMVGLCYHASECKQLGGQPHGSCAQGFGVCCTVVKTCGESSVVNNTVFTSSGVSLDPDSGVYVCTVAIYKSRPDVVQLRLSFETFQLAGPVEGNCVVDRFVVTGQNRNDIIPAICGYNSGKHVYIDVDETEGPVSLTLLSSGAQGVPRELRVKVTHLTLDHPLHAPHNCLQYYNEPKGSIESFNYASASTGSTPGYFNNLDYAICFKKSADGHCGIVYSNVAAGGVEYPFEISNIESDGISTVPEGQAGADSFDCPNDYISTSTTRLCGYHLNDGYSSVDYTTNTPVVDNSNGPLILRFHTDGNVTGRGFHLNYILTCYYSGSGSGTSTTGLALPSAVTRMPLLT